MSKTPITSPSDFKAFFQAYNEKRWDEVFSYLSDDCVWNASERRVEGRDAIQQYWTQFHGGIKESLGTPQNIVFGDGVAYLEVPIHMEFTEDCMFTERNTTKATLWISGEQMPTHSPLTAQFRSAEYTASSIADRPS